MPRAHGSPTGWTWRPQPSGPCPQSRCPQPESSRHGERGQCWGLWGHQGVPEAVSQGLEKLKECLEPHFFFLLLPSLAVTTTPGAPLLPGVAAWSCNPDLGQEGCLGATTQKALVHSSIACTPTAQPQAHTFLCHCTDKRHSVPRAVMGPGPWGGERSLVAPNPWGVPRAKAMQYQAKARARCLGS